MIWFFLAGMIAGAVGWHMFVMWYGRRIRKHVEFKPVEMKLSPEEAQEFLREIHSRTFDSEQEADAFIQEMKNKIENRRKEHD